MCVLQHTQYLASSSSARVFDLNIHAVDAAAAVKIFGNFFTRHQQLAYVLYMCILKFCKGFYYVYIFFFSYCNYP